MNSWAAHACNTNFNPAPTVPAPPRSIGESANREAALLELHHFLAAHPQVDVASYLANSSDQFRAYIYKGLAKVRSTLAFAQPHAAAHASVAQHAAASASARPAPLGVAPSGSGGGAVADKENSPTEEAAVAAAAAAARASGGNNLAELRDRLNKTQASGAGSIVTAGCGRLDDGNIADAHCLVWFA